MKISAFVKLYEQHPELQDAEFGIADGCLCIIGLKGDDRRYWHVPVVQISSNVTRESLSNRLANALAQASETARDHAPVAVSAKAVNVGAEEMKKALSATPTREKLGLGDPA